MILGDNIFNGNGFSNLLAKSINNVKTKKKATVFGYYMKDAKRYGVVELDKEGKAISIEEKPQKPKGNHAVVGLYFYPNSVIEIAKGISPSSRGELEITSINQEYLNLNQLNIEIMGQGFVWLDTGTHETLMQASDYIKTIQNRQGVIVGCIEVIAFQMGYISKQQLLEIGQSMKNTNYGKYLIKTANEI